MSVFDNVRSLSPTMRGLASAYAVSGVVHLVRPSVFEGIIPAQLPRHRELVYVSGVAELLCLAGLLNTRTRPAAGMASAALLIAVLPANVEMARQEVARLQRRGASPKRVAAVAGSMARLPLQWPLIRSSFDLWRHPHRTAAAGVWNRA